MNEENRDEVLNLINEWWISGTIPEDMLTARVVSLYKKGNPEILENYRPISEDCRNMQRDWGTQAC